MEAYSIARATRSSTPRRHAGAHSLEGQLDTLLAGELAQLLLGARLDLADAFLGHAQLAAQLLQGLLIGAAEAEAAGEHVPLAVVEAAEHPLDDLLTAPVAPLVLVDVAPGIGGGG